MIDIPRAWEIARQTPAEKHHTDCSFRTHSGEFLCNCDVLYKHPEYLDSDLYGAGGTVIPTLGSREEISSGHVRFGSGCVYRIKRIAERNKGEGYLQPGDEVVPMLVYSREGGVKDHVFVRLLDSSVHGAKDAGGSYFFLEETGVRVDGESLAKLRTEHAWMREELRAIGIQYCDVDVDKPGEVQGGLAKGLIYSFLEGAFERLESDQHPTSKVASSSEEAESAGDGRRGLVGVDVPPPEPGESRNSLGVASRIDALLAQMDGLDVKARARSLRAIIGALIDGCYSDGAVDAEDIAEVLKAQYRMEVAS